MIKLFVYGSLKRGFWNNHYFRSSKLLGAGSTTSNFILLNYGVPAATRNEGGLPILGEVWLTSKFDLCRIDNLEGHPRNRYTREKETVLLKEGPTLVETFIYCYNHKYNKCQSVCPINDKKQYYWEPDQ